MEHIRSSTEETIPSPECSQFGEEKMGLVWGPKIKWEKVPDSLPIILFKRKDA